MDDYVSSNGEKIVAMEVSPEMIGIISFWCNGVTVEEIDPHDVNVRYPALNVGTPEGPKRASLGDYVLKHANGTFDVQKPSAFKRENQRKES